jgi:hypothetical protein
MTQLFDLDDGQWSIVYWQNANGNGIDGNFSKVLNWWDIHPDWWGEIKRLARIHGGLEFGGKRSEGS